MLVFGTEMELITFIFVLFECLIFFFQFIYYLCRPQDKKRLLYLILLFLLLFYNVGANIFPDQHIPLPIIFQNIIAYSSGFLMACYLPYYFYKVYNLQKLRFLALYGVLLFVALPFVAFFLIGYSLDGDIDKASERGLFIPMLYGAYFVFAIFKELFKKLRENINSENIISTVIVCCAVLPWSILPVVVYMDSSQTIEVLVCNTGFCIMTIIFIRQSIIESKAEYKLLQEMNKANLIQEERYEQNCKFYNLTTRETGIVKLIDKGLKYKSIAEELFISERTVSKHVQNIFIKVGVSNKVELINKLNE
ncbi:DNA-binding CsgD family transcriptional regulator/CDP-diglyceride synthetase [Pedobacter cryoconitis]|uniref:DNA-binding CsgD family transcriptional regulator/CDP-diglyceride synthetase n=1 Tax=Pedobacter cryoconitis TaxID=188932 RepID=A0A7W9DX48_9SPHI|nr:helix-turn-helix transcriptional regulator [Pedobacter cryoconitis]MBB5634551.1 DNA-binding CsgD family transcriptional regulator/CDP-diglyceride synthetase [Pedobacter cryoconitis]MBB6272322.1 DNA-binding CsgD family transcriptional regulator/CDP-diglyceride synthetase [Pedobacter cryoconitis]